MKPVDQYEALGIICKAQGCWGIFISIGWRGEQEPSSPGAWLDHVHRAAPVLTAPEAAQIIIDRQGFLLFDTEAEMLSAFEPLVGDRGPTEANRYDGSCCVSAITADPEGRLGRENT